MTPYGLLLTPEAMDAAMLNHQAQLELRDLDHQELTARHQSELASLKAAAAPKPVAPAAPTFTADELFAAPAPDRGGEARMEAARESFQKALSHEG